MIEIKNHVIFFIAFLAIFLNIHSDQVLADNSLRIEITRITNDSDSTTKINPEIYDNIIIWEIRDEGGSVDVSGLYYIDLTDRSLHKLVHYTGHYYITRSTIYKDKIVWNEWNSYPGPVYLYNITTERKEELDLGGLIFGISGMYEEKIVGVTVNNTTGYDIYLYNLTTGEEVPICTDPGDQQAPLIWGDYVVWLDIPSRGNIYGYDLTTQEKFLISPAGAECRYKDMYGDYVLLDCDGYGNYYIYNLRLKRIEWKLPEFYSKRGTYTDWTSLWGDYVLGVTVVGYAYPSKPSYLFNLSSGEVYKMNVSLPMRNDMYGNRIVYLMPETDDIYLLEFNISNETPPPPPPPPTPPPPEKKPQVDITLPVTAIALMVVVGLAFLYNGLRRG